MTYLILDLVIAALLAMAAWRGYRRGFVLTLCGFLAIFVAYVGAAVVSNVLTEPLSRTIAPAVEQHIQQYVDDFFLPGDASPEDASSGQTDPLEGLTAPQEEENAPALPLGSLLELLEQSRLYRGFAQALQQAVDKGTVSSDADAVRAVSSFIARQVAQTFLFMVAVVLILVLWFFLSHALDLAFRLPVLSTLNRWSGAALGVVRGAILLLIICWLLKGGLLSQDAIQNTYLLRLFCTFNPLTLLS